MFTPTISECYIDGIGKARFSGGVVRLDLVSATEILDTPDKDAPIIVKQRLIMPPEAFLRSVTMLRRLSDQLVEAGVLKQATATPEPGPGAPV